MLKSSPAARAAQARLLARGRVLPIITCPDAIAALGRLRAHHGSYRAAIEQALIQSAEGLGQSVAPFGQSFAGLNQSDLPSGLRVKG